MCSFPFTRPYLCSRLNRDTHKQERNAPPLTLAGADMKYRNEGKLRGFARNETTNTPPHLLQSVFSQASCVVVRERCERKQKTTTHHHQQTGNQRDLRKEGEFEHLARLAQMKGTLWARKAYTAFVTCDYTNRLLGLGYDCRKYENATVIPEVQRRR